MMGSTKVRISHEVSDDQFYRYINSGYILFLKHGTLQYIIVHNNQIKNILSLPQPYSTFKNRVLVAYDFQDFQFLFDSREAKKCYECSQNL